MALSALGSGERFRIVRVTDQAPDFLRYLAETGLRIGAEGTIRKKWASSIEHNAVHGSDAEETARFELSYFFADYELGK